MLEPLPELLLDRAQFKGGPVRVQHIRGLLDTWKREQQSGAAFRMTPQRGWSDNA